MIKGVGHIGIGVEDIQAYLEMLHRSFGVPIPPIKEIPERKAKVALVQMGPVSLEVIQDDDEDGLLGSFVKKHGNGIHHYCLITDDIDEDIAVLKSRGVKMMHEQPRVGLRGKRIAFISPESMEGIPVELSEP